MKFPRPTVNIKEIARKYHRAELKAAKNKGKLKWKQLTTEAKRDKRYVEPGHMAAPGLVVYWFGRISSMQTLIASPPRHANWRPNLPPRALACRGRGSDHER